MTHASIGSAGFFEQRPIERNPATRPAFGGPVNLVRLLLQRQASMPVVCIACRTLNGKTARTCIGCDGKLPAYFAGVGHSSSGNAATRATHRFAAHWPAIEPRWRLVAGAAVLLVLVAVAFQAWFVAHAAARSRPVVPALTQRASMPADASLAAPTLRTMAIERVRVEATPVEPVIASAPPSSQPSNRRIPSGEPALERVSLVGATRAQGPAQASDPLAGCQSLWLFARASCLQNSCAQPPLKRHPQCQQVVAQRRLDDARRDGIVSN